MAIAPYRYTSKKIAKGWRSKNAITLVGLGFTGGSVQFFSDNLFVVTYICLSLVLTIDLCYSQWIFFCIFKKDTKINKQKKKDEIS